jgi:hypothetical protein
MTIDDLTIGQARELVGMFGAAQQQTQPAMVHGDGRPVIVRSRDAGVQFGYLKGYCGSTVYLSDARQMWTWTAAQGGTLLDCAVHGVTSGKFSAAAPAVTVFNACAIIDVQPAAIESLKARSW